MRNYRIVKVLIALVVIIGSRSGISQSVNVDLSTEYQIVRGFGGMNHTTWVSDLTEEQREKAFSTEPGNIGLSILRVHVDPDTNRFSDHIPTATYAREQGALIFATPWNAPSNMTFVDDELTKVDPAKYADYVDHLNRFNDYMETNEVPLYAISVQNEPDYGEWTRWTSAEIVDFLKNFGQDINNKVIAPESFQFRRELSDPILNDAGAAANVEIIGGHIYGGGLFDYPLAREKDKEVWMTEHLLGSGSWNENDWNLALTVGNEIQDCMEANFNVYVWWYIRRFYGLIADDGNITQKGWVMSHYSKFIRNGSVRVGADVSGASGVSVTAYKTDTSYVLVAINNNSSEVTLDFNIQNGTIDTLTKFTSTETRLMGNDGGVAISAGTFSAPLAPKSITTFASSTYNAPRYGNVFPVANAGEDLLLSDEDGNGVDTVSLNGSASVDSDGDIVEYVWSLNGNLVSNEISLDVQVGIGQYDYILTVTDNEGAVQSDTLHIVLESPYATEVYFETECATVGSTWETNEDGNASKGKYVMGPLGTEFVNGASSDTADHLIIEMDIPESGFYKIWGRVIAPNANDDSYWVKMDDGEWTLWNSIPVGNDWHWDDIHNSNAGGDAIVYQLDAGKHTLSLCFREDGAKLDKILVTNSGATPEDLGEDAGNCPDDPILVNQSIVKSMNVNVFPNPASEQVTISCEDGIRSIDIYSLDGKKVFEQQYGSMIQQVKLRPIFEKGIYTIVVSNTSNSQAMKLIFN